MIEQIPVGTVYILSNIGLSDSCRSAPSRRRTAALKLELMLTRQFDLKLSV